MKTLGQHLRNVRKIRKKTLDDLARETKIKKKFISYIENEKWNKLPDFPVVLGFVKNISNNLDLNTENVVALLKRDYPPQKLTVNPKPEIKQEFSWNPKLTFFLGVCVVVITIISYLTFQYFNFITPPKLEIYSPEDGVSVAQEFISVSGSTDPDVSVVVNDQPALVDENGYFYTEIEAVENLRMIEVVATSRSKRQTKKTIQVNIEG